MDGPLETQAYVIKSQGAPLELTTITIPAMGASQVQVDITHCGLCHTDIHMKNNDWGVSNYPMVAGHEGVGFVSSVGPLCKVLKIGDRVAIGWAADSCGTCKYCCEGRENICTAGYQGTFLGSAAGCWGKSPRNEFGGCFAKVVRIEEKFATKIPESVPTSIICPLVCGGGTVFEPICNYVTLGTNVGVYSIGGLGTAAIKLAKLAGANVTAFSGSARKQPGCVSAGASKFVLTSDTAAMEAAASSLDLLIDTCPANNDISPLMNLLSFNGKYVRVGIPPASNQHFEYNWIPLIFTQRQIVGSIVTGSKRMNLLMNILEDNLKTTGSMKDDENWGVCPMKFEDVNEAFKLVADNALTGHRVVLEW
eukprot:CAMPEP_0182419854 /NCGR_PEP_ID=MMETSP1167-20130531/4209_1 /TAXON_ID=2988 /ORGANISM="Mallomonas Sp, Strain CCMP3275" /LENGTH=364 /DNA_ID=CAMNT_0024594989 /DNA_START=56 /DNA_END=1150 /DNA_ORIENTATION=-